MSSKPKSASRRHFMEQAMGATAVVAGAGLLRVGTVAAGEMPKLDPNDTQAQQFKYVHESTTAEQECANCQLWQGGDAEWGGCSIFPDKAVSAKGWCQAWVERTT